MKTTRMLMNDHDTHAALARVFSTWLLVGLSQMSPLQWVQLVAAIVASVYSVVQIYFLFRDKWRKERE